MTIVDYDNKVGIGVIAAFSPSGRIKPIYFQAIENYEKIPVKVEVMRENDEPTRIVYDCVYVQSGMERQIRLEYIKREHLWMIGKR